MKNVIIIALLISGLNLLQSCTKEEGPAGPTGPQGNTGLTGPTGAAGQNGVSGARAFYFTNVAMPAVQTITVDSGFVDSSAILVYYQDQDAAAGLWYQAPGLGRANLYQVRYYLQQNDATTQTLRLFLHNPDGTTYGGASVIFTKLKLVLIPHTFGKKDAVDYSDYKATMKYYGLAE